jgi:hypothetical protein
VSESALMECFLHHASHDPRSSEGAKTSDDFSSMKYLSLSAGEGALPSSDTRYSTTLLGTAHPLNGKVVLKFLEMGMTFTVTTT